MYYNIILSIIQEQGVAFTNIWLGRQVLMERELMGFVQGQGSHHDPMMDILAIFIPHFLKSSFWIEKDKINLFKFTHTVSRYNFY